MLRYENLSIRNKLWLMTGSFFASLALVVIVAFWTQHRLSSDVDVIANRYFVASQHLLKADAKLYRAISAERSVIFVSANSPKFNNLVNYHRQNIEEANALFSQFRQTLNDPKVNQLMAQYNDLAEQWQSLTFQIIELRKHNGREERRQASRLSLNDASQQFALMHDVIDQIIEYVNTESERTLATAEQNTSYSSFLISAVSLGVLVFGSLMTWFAVNIIAKPLNALTARLKQISSGDGDLTQRLEEGREDEIGETAAAFNRFTENQAQIIQQVKQAMQAFMTSMTTVGENMDRLHHSTSEQQTDSDKVADAMQQMSQAVNDIAASAAQAAESAQDANSLAVNGKKVVSESVSTIHDITTNIGATSEVVKKLDSRTHSISSVTNAISEITDQTNLLALNAAIEAARAGEQGRGFAVVADEVRNLAKRTQELTDEIRTNIDSLNQESTDAMQAMELSLENSHQLDDKAGLSGQALEEITSSVDAISGMNLMVASAVEEQSVTAVEINRNVEHLKESAIDADQHAMQTLKEVSNLLELADDMQSLLNRFKTEAARH